MEESTAQLQARQDILEIRNERYTWSEIHLQKALKACSAKERRRKELNGVTHLGLFEQTSSYTVLCMVRNTCFPGIEEDFGILRRPWKDILDHQISCTNRRDSGVQRKLRNL